MTDARETISEEEGWNGPFDPESYTAARRILEEDLERVRTEIQGETRRRVRIVAIAAIVWAVCSVALAFINPEFLLVAEIGWIAIVAWAVFWLLPAFMGKGNLGDVYTQYGEQLDKLEAAGIPMPKPSCIEDLVAAIDLVSPAE